MFHPVLYGDNKTIFTEKIKGSILEASSFGYIKTTMLPCDIYTAKHIRFSLSSDTWFYFAFDEYPALLLYGYKSQVVFTLNHKTYKINPGKICLLEDLKGPQFFLFSQGIYECIVLQADIISTRFERLKSALLNSIATEIKIRIN